MRRITLDDGTWFDADQAESWSETTNWDGNNRISGATGSQWNHEVLWKTAKGRWAILGTSHWDGVQDWNTPITAEEAYKWILRCGYPIPRELEALDRKAEV